MGEPKFKDIGRVEVRAQEECAELIMAICKADRFGYSNYHPDRQPNYTNAHQILAEIEDVKRVLAELQDFIEDIIIR